jgi:osmoprotectant transport system permease protein
VIAQVVIHRRETTCESRNGLCPGWIRDHLGDYLDPLWRHVELVVVAVAVGFAIAFALALLAHRHRWLAAPIVGITGVLYTIPSLAALGVLITITGFGFLTAEIALVSYTLLIIFRNVVAGLDNVPAETRDAALGMGLTERQLLWRVELPLAAPAIFAGLRIAATTTVGLATLAFFAGAGGLGEQIASDVNFKSNVALAGGLCIALAVALDLLLLGAERVALPWRRAGA